METGWGPLTEVGRSGTSLVPKGPLPSLDGHQVTISSGICVRPPLNGVDRLPVCRPVRREKEVETKHPRFCVLGPWRYRRTELRLGALP